MTKEALTLALESLEWHNQHMHRKISEQAITAIKEALAQPEQELVCVCGAVWEGQELVETPPQRTWVGLTDEEILSISADCASSHQHTDIHFARAIEAALKAKNT